jgi:hypothetical protein
MAPFMIIDLVLRKPYEKPLPPGKRQRSQLVPWIVEGTGSKSKNSAICAPHSALIG